MIYSYMIENKTLLPESDVQLLDEQVQLLNEMHFSKKDLQDPKTLDKILKRKHSFETINKFIDFLLAVIDVGAAFGATYVGGFGLGLITAIASGYLFVSLKNALDKVPKKWYVKNSKKYSEQVKKAIEKYTKKMESDPKNKEKYKKIIDNCNNVLATIEKRRQEAIRRWKEAEHDAGLQEYREVVNWFENPTGFGDEYKIYDFRGFAYKCKFLKIPEKAIYEALDSAIKKNKRSFYSISVDWGKENAKRLEEYIKFPTSDYKLTMDDSTNKPISILDINKIKAKFGSTIYFIQENEEYTIFYSPETHKMFETNIDLEDDYEMITPYGVADKSECKSNIEEILKEADVELGYYLINECPEEVMKKEFPVKF